MIIFSKMLIHGNKLFMEKILLEGIQMKERHFYLIFPDSKEINLLVIIFAGDTAKMDFIEVGRSNKILIFTSIII